MSKDDRASFKADAISNSIALGNDKEIRKASVDLIISTEKHRYSYLWTWMGVPVIQMPSDIMALQEAVWEAKPDVIVETGVARGGSVIFFASLLTLLGNGGKVIGVDIDIRAHNRETIESHPQGRAITLIEGSSVAQETLRQVKAAIPAGAKVMVVLDSDHSKDHVFAELQAYASLVSVGQYLVVADTLLGFLDEAQTPRDRSQVWLKGNEPLAALNQFLQDDRRFERDSALNGKLIMASSPDGYVRRVA